MAKTTWHIAEFVKTNPSCNMIHQVDILVHNYKTVLAKVESLLAKRFRPVSNLCHSASSARICVASSMMGMLEPASKQDGPGASNNSAGKSSPSNLINSGSIFIIGLSRTSSCNSMVTSASVAPLTSINKLQKACIIIHAEKHLAGKLCFILFFYLLTLLRHWYERKKNMNLFFYSSILTFGNNECAWTYILCILSWTDQVRKPMQIGMEHCLDETPDPPVLESPG